MCNIGDKNLDGKSGEYALVRVLPGTSRDKWPHLYLTQEHANIMMNALLAHQRSKSGRYFGQRQDFNE